MIKNWIFNETDETVLREIKDFIPDKIFDAHAHVYRVKDLNIPESVFYNAGPEEAGVKEFRGYMDKILGSGCLQGSFLMPVPTKYGDIKKANDHVSKQLEIDNESFGGILISPNYPKEDVNTYLKNDRIKGLKPYHLYSNNIPTWESYISDYLPK